MMVSSSLPVRLRSSPPPKRGRHPGPAGHLDRSPEVAILAPSEEGAPPDRPGRCRQDLLRVAILAPSEEGAPHARHPLAAFRQAMLRSSPPPKRGRHVAGEAELLEHVAVAILAPSEEGAPPDSLLHVCRGVGVVAILAPSEEGAPRSPASARAAAGCCDPRPLRRGGATRASARSQCRRARGCDPRPLRRGGATHLDVPRGGPGTGVAILAPSEEGAPPEQVVPGVGGVLIVAILAPSEEGAPRTAPPARRSSDSGCDPRPLRRGGATTHADGTPQRSSGCDPRPLRRGGATDGHGVSLSDEFEVAILAPSEEGAPPSRGRPPRGPVRGCDPRPLRRGGATLPGQGKHGHPNLVHSQLCTK